MTETIDKNMTIESILDLFPHKAQKLAARREANQTQRDKNIAQEKDRLERVGTEAVVEQGLRTVAKGKQGVLSQMTGTSKRKIFRVLKRSLGPGFTLKDFKDADTRKEFTDQERQQREMLAGINKKAS